MCLNRTDVAFNLPSNDHRFVAAKISNIGIELIHQAAGNGEFHQQSWPSQQKKGFHSLSRRIGYQQQYISWQCWHITAWFEVRTLQPSLLAPRLRSSSTWPTTIIPLNKNTQTNKQTKLLYLIQFIINIQVPMNNKSIHYIP